ncbi:hypothetical protein O3P69_004852 [Scylla paramamosain]|uniref:Uncharacterized protein n=1 Tax=Scylla paramamosain TaxID=85552 RepID=A0AAW0UBI2_SCYPA
MAKRKEGQGRKELGRREKRKRRRREEKKKKHGKMEEEEEKIRREEEELRNFSYFQNGDASLPGCRQVTRGGPSLAALLQDHLPCVMASVREAVCVRL